MGLIDKLLIGGGAALLASALRNAQETRRRRSSPPRFDDRISESEFIALVTQVANRTPRVVGADVSGMTVVLHIRSMSGLSTWQAEVDFNDYGRLTGAYWINTDNADSQIPGHFAEALSAQVIERAHAHQGSRDREEWVESGGQAGDRGSSATPPLAPPGWYPTPEGHRYWTGVAWTDEPARRGGHHVDPSIPRPRTRRPSNPGAVAFAWILAILTIGYMLPWAVAMSRGTPNRASIGWINFLLGWTVIGWIVTLVMACAR